MAASPELSLLQALPLPVLHPVAEGLKIQPCSSLA